MLNPSFDLSDLSGDSTPCSLDDFLADNEECPPDESEIRALLDCPVDGRVRLGIGGGFVTVKRVS